MNFRRLRGPFLTLGLGILALPTRTEAQTPPQSPLLAQLNTIYSQVEAKFAKASKEHPTICFAYQCCVGASIQDTLKHYGGLIEDTASFVNYGQGYVGGGSAGYMGIRSYLDDASVEDLNRDAPAAYAAYEDAKAKGSPLKWEQWVKLFHSKSHASEGDPKRALEAIIVTHGWARNAYSGAPDQKHMLPSVLISSNYSVGPFTPKAFDLDLPYEGFGSWGKAYKVVAGMNLALALREKGYSDEDIRFAVRQANTLYEAHDMLYDHFGKASKCGTEACPDDPKRELAPVYDDWIVLVKQKIRENPELLGQLAGATVGAGDVASLIQKVVPLNIDLNNEIILNHMLLSLRVSRPDVFEKAFGSLFSKVSKGDKIRAEFDDSAKDVAYMDSGADFTLAKMSGEPRPKKFAGVIGKLGGFDSSCHTSESEKPQATPVQNVEHSSPSTSPNLNSSTGTNIPLTEPF